MRARDREISAANHWASRQPLSSRLRTMGELDSWATRINGACGVGAPVVRIGLRLHAARGLRLH